MPLIEMAYPDIRSIDHTLDDRQSVNGDALQYHKIDLTEA